MILDFKWIYSFAANEYFYQCTHEEENNTYWSVENKKTTGLLGGECGREQTRACNWETKEQKLRESWWSEDVRIQERGEENERECYIYMCVCDGASESVWCTHARERIELLYMQLCNRRKKIATLLLYRLKTDDLCENIWNEMRRCEGYCSHTP